MIIEQISVFIENKKGRLSAIADLLAKNNIDISALSLADTDEYGVIRMIVSDPYKTKNILLENGIIGKVTDVLAIAIEDKPGGFAKALKVLNDRDIEIKYMYACIAHDTGKAIMIVRVDNAEEVNKILYENGVDVDSPASIYRISSKN